VRMDLQPRAQWQCARVADSGLIYFKWLRGWRMENPKGFYFYL
jgi:hypothetical protein